jgi:hypothetical protein
MAKKTLREVMQGDHEAFAAEVERLSVTDLDKRLNGLAKAGDEIEEEKENNEGLKRARDSYNEASGPFKDAKKANKLKTKYVIQLIREKGGQ